MGLSISPPSGNLNTFLASSSVVAAGSNQGGATQLTNAINNVTAVPLGAGVKLPPASAGMYLIIRNNDTVRDLKVYPTINNSINELGVNNPYIIYADTSLQFFATSTTQWYTVDAAFS